MDLQTIEPWRLFFKSPKVLSYRNFV